jgi:hypothetical protein
MLLGESPVLPLHAGPRMHWEHSVQGTFLLDSFLIYYGGYSVADFTLVGQG